MLRHGLAAAAPEWFYIGRDVSGGSAFRIPRQSIAERQPRLLAGSPDVFSGLKIFGHIQTAACQADDTGARPFGEQRSPADRAEASNKSWRRVATSQRTGHRNCIQGHKHSGIERRAKRPLTHPTVADATYREAPQRHPPLITFNLLSSRSFEPASASRWAVVHRTRLVRISSIMTTSVPVPTLP
jgi:hypothetical protein